MFRGEGMIVEMVLKLNLRIVRFGDFVLVAWHARLTRARVTCR